MNLKQYQVKYIYPIFPTNIKKHLENISYEFSVKDTYTLICNCHLPIKEKICLLKLLATIIDENDIYDIFIAYEKVLSDINKASFVQDDCFFSSLKDVSNKHPIKAIIKNKEKYYINLNHKNEIVDFSFIDSSSQQKWDKLTFSYVDIPLPLKEGDIIKLGNKKYIIKGIGVEERLKSLCDFIDTCVTIIPLKHKDDYSYHEHISILNLDYKTCD